MKKKVDDPWVSQIRIGEHDAAEEVRPGSSST